MRPCGCRYRYPYLPESCSTWRMFDDHHDRWVGTTPGTGARDVSGTLCNLERFAEIGNWSGPGQWSDAE